ncbi:MAG: 1,4-alpha-glucan branching protein domain-containing protein [Spirochaetia bacterium]
MNNGQKGKGVVVQFVFNAHLPFVRFPQYDDFLEERWFFEAMLHSYLPMLSMMDKLKSDGVKYQISWIISSTLLSMVDDDILKKRFLRYAEKLLRLVEIEKKRCEDLNDLKPIVLCYEEKIQNSLSILKAFNGSVISALKYFADEGFLELIPTAATSAFLPLYQACPQVVRAQISAGITSFSEKLGGYKPQGFWLPHSGYFPGLELYLQEQGIAYTFITTSGLLGEKGLADPDSCKVYQSPTGFKFIPVSRFFVDRIFDQQFGYPTHPVYRDFYRDIAFELPEEEIGDYALHHGEKVPTGLKYFARTGKTEHKDIYRPSRANDQARDHADEFVTTLIDISKEIRSSEVKSPVMTCILDLEFFGDWWFEGTTFCEHALRTLSKSEYADTSVPKECISTTFSYKKITPSFSSWGEDSYAQIWLSDKNDWLIRHLYILIERMSELAHRFNDESGLRKRILDQAAKEVMLALSSDWPMLLHAGSNERFASSQLRRFLANFYKICDGLSSNVVYTDWFIRLEKQDNLYLGSQFSYKSFIADHPPVCAPAGE